MPDQPPDPNVSKLEPPLRDEERRRVVELAGTIAAGIVSNPANGDYCGTVRESEVGNIADLALRISKRIVVNARAIQ